MKNLNTTIIYLLSSVVIYGQYADCDNLLILTDSIYTSNNIKGYGNHLEFLDHEQPFMKEKNSIWYQFTAPTTGTFTFDIIPQNPNHDWDFLLYEHKKMFCKRIADHKIAPLRYNLSRSAQTGLSATAIKDFVNPGINDNYSRAITINQGKSYVLIVNNPKLAVKRHTLQLHFPNLERSKAVKDTLQIQQPTNGVFKMLIKDKQTLQPLSSHVHISGLRKRLITLEKVNKYETSVPLENKNVFINASSEGYMLTSTSFKINKNNPATDLTILLERIRVGEKVNLKRIQFHGNRADFLPSARGSLLALLNFMKLNKKVKIEIQGHVNGPREKNSREYKKLSEDRAKAVKAYLVKKGIQQNRIDFVGYGNSKMLYPIPKNADEMSANRRVEIKIIANE